MIDSIWITRPLKAIDIVLPPPKTEKEDWERFLNRKETELRMMHYTHKIKIEVKESIL